MSANETIEDARAKLFAYRTGVDADGTPHPTKSLRALAREIGMSTAGVVKFLGGTTPYTDTTRLLLAWLDRQRATGRSERVAYLIGILAQEFAPTYRAEAERRLRAAYEQVAAEEEWCPPPPAPPPPEAHEAPAPQPQVAPAAPPANRPGKRYSVVTVRCRECDVDVVASRYRSHMWMVHGIRGAALP